MALRVSNPLGDPSIKFVIKNFALCWQIPESSLYEAISKLKKLNLLPEWLDYESRQYNSIEAEVRDSLHQKLGLFDFHLKSVTKVVNLQTSSKKSENSNYSQQVELIEFEISESQFKNSESQFEISESQFGNSETRFEISESQSPEPASS